MRTLRIRSGRALPLAALVAIAPIVFGQSPAPDQVAPPKPAPQSSPPAGPLPSARDVIDRHVKAIGGREAILSLSSSHAVGTIEIPAAGMKGTLEVFAAKPDSSLMRVSLPGVGEIQEGFNGTIGWSISAMTGPSLLQGKQLEQRKLDSDFYSELQPDGRYESMTVVEKTTFEGRPCYKIRLVRRGGEEDFQFYDAESGLKAGSITTRETPMGTVTGTTVETDYKKFGKLLQPTKLTQSVMGVQQVMAITTIDYDKVDPSVFDPPAAIKAMMK
jgi:hypothetical protein